MSIVEQLTEIYLKEEDWHEAKLSVEESDGYFRKLLSQGNIFYIARKGTLLAYMEVWFVAKEQLAQIMEGKPFHGSEEEVEDGQYAYVNSIYVKPEFRHLGIVNRLHRMAHVSKRKNNLIAIILKEHKHGGRFRVFNIKGEYNGRIKNNRKNNNTADSASYANASRN